jgi:hypothetical protein
MPSLREMRPTDMVKFSKYCIPKYYGVIAVEDGKDIGAAAIVWGDKDRAYLSLEITDELRKHPAFMHRVAKKLTKAGSQTGELFTIEDADEPSAAKWLERLGFRPTGELINGERVLRHGG